MTRIVRFEKPNSSMQQPCWGIEIEGIIWDVGSTKEFANTSLLDVIGNWEHFQSQVAEATSSADRVNDARLICPIPNGGKILCIGLNYRDHAIESGMEIPSEPVVFNKLAGTLCGPDSVVTIPAVSQQVDFEAELVLVIGRRAWQVSERDADQHIFGYSCGHDVSARDWQLGRPGGQWLLGKSFPGFAPIGPAIVTRDAVENVADLSVALRVNGETLQDSSTKQLIFSPAKLISFLSQCCVLDPGDVIFTGTPPGVGMARKPQRFLKTGDVCEVEIEGVGILRNRFE